MSHVHVCGLYYLVPQPKNQYYYQPPQRHYLPQLSLSVKSKIVATTSRTVLTQTFVNPKNEVIPELRYTFPLYDGVSVVGFVCTINDERVIRGVVKERAEARKVYQEAVDRGETAGLLEQLPDASDVFTTTVGNVPANATLKVDITYLGELKHDAEVDGVRFTIPTSIAPRYGNYPGEVLQSNVSSSQTGISIVVDVELPDGSNVKNVQSPSHPISVTLGNTADGAARGAEMSLQKASATLSQSETSLGNDFVLQVVATNTNRPVAVLETHPTFPNQRALMATLVPKFNLPQSKPEIVFLCDRSGSMGMGERIPNLKKALQLFLKSLPVGVKFNICSFGSHFKFLFSGGSKTYDESTLKKAMKEVETFDANFGGTEIYEPMKAAFEKRHEDMDLEVFLLTDGEIWDQNRLFTLVSDEVAKTKGKVRVFTLGIGNDVSHALIEGVANAGNGFSQSVGDTENMNSKVVRMLKASLTPHINDYTLEVKYGAEPAGDAPDDDDFEVVEKVMDALSLEVTEAPPPEYTPSAAEGKKPISLFDESADPDTPMTDATVDNNTAGGKYSHVPPVPEPKLLQAPFAIPPLYPFNRTTVYLLLSPGSVQKQPKSVVLRGTSQYGPLELEVPVTILEEPGETIHQLAARKAVRELEDGRGWIYHARDATDSANPLLKDKYPGRFSDMVEREAVRLGVRFQVGGKWCSFVAVEANDEPRDEVSDGQAVEAEELSLELHAATPAMKGARRQMTAKKTTSGPALRARLASFAARKAAVPSPSMGGIPQVGFASPASKRRRVARTGISQASEKKEVMLTSTPEPTPFGVQHVQLMSSLQSPQQCPPGMVYAQPQCGVQQQQQQSVKRRFLSSMLSKRSSAAPPPPPPPAPMPMASAPPPGGAQSYGGGEMHHLDCNLNDLEGIVKSSSRSSRAASFDIEADVCDEEEVVEEEEDAQGFGLYDSATPAAPPVPSIPAPVPPPPAPVGGSAPTRVGANLDEDAQLSLLVSWQGFTGSWKWETELLELVFGKKKVDIPAHLGGKKASEALATAVVLVFLAGRLAMKKDEWEMMADKAKDWLEEELRRIKAGMGPDDWLAEARGFMEKQGVKF